MFNLLSQWTINGKKFGFGLEGGRPALFLFDFPVYLYALLIVTGMALAILIAGLYFKKRGYDPYDITVYALVLIPIGVLGARAYVYIFPWAGEQPDWSGYFRDFRNGGLGIYGGVIAGYIAAFVLSKIKKHDFRVVTDSILPGVLIAQSIGRWGNFANQEAYGNLISHEYDSLLHAQSGIFARFNGYAVWIDGGWYPDIRSGGWYQATFFYESMCTLLGFLICVLVLTRSKHYKLGWCTAFYGIYYGIVRLITEGLRSDSLYLYIGTIQTDIKISQLVSIFAIVLGVWTLTKIYRKQLHALYKKMFASDRDEISKSRWILIALSAVFLAVGITMFVLSSREEFGQSKFIVAFFATAASVYCALGAWSCWDRLKVYCGDPHCANYGKRILPPEQWQTVRQKSLTQVICYAAAIAVLVGFSLFSLIKWGVQDDIPNGIVLAVVAFAAAAAIFGALFLRSYRTLIGTQPQPDSPVSAQCECGAREVKLNKFLLFVFPPKVYRDYGVDDLKPWVDVDKAQRKARREEKRAAKNSANNNK